MFLCFRAARFVEVVGAVNDFFVILRSPLPYPAMNTEFLERWQGALDAVARPEKIKTLQRFFKTGPGEYAEGDVMIGVTVPDNRKVSQEFHDAPREVIEAMLRSAIHEHRLAALLALVRAYEKSRRTPERRDHIINVYLANVDRCNNWDLVDLSAPKILGPEIAAGRRLDEHAALSPSPSLWARRVAVVATLCPVMKHGQVEQAVEQCRLHVADREPLMQKAVGWVMREVGKKDLGALLDFLNDHIGVVSATTLSYATERLDAAKRAELRLRRQRRIFFNA